MAASGSSYASKVVLNGQQANRIVCIHGRHSTTYGIACHDFHTGASHYKHCITAAKTRCLISSHRSSLVYRNVLRPGNEDSFSEQSPCTSDLQSILSTVHTLASRETASSSTHSVFAYVDFIMCWVCMTARVRIRG